MGQAGPACTALLPSGPLGGLPVPTCCVLRGSKDPQSGASFLRSTDRNRFQRHGRQVECWRTPCSPSPGLPRDGPRRPAPGLACGREELLELSVEGLPTSPSGVTEGPRPSALLVPFDIRRESLGWKMLAEEGIPETQRRRSGTGGRDMGGRPA